MYTKRICPVTLFPTVPKYRSPFFFLLPLVSFCRVATPDSLLVGLNFSYLLFFSAPSAMLILLAGPPALDPNPIFNPLSTQKSSLLLIPDLPKQGNPRSLEAWEDRVRLDL